jgi:hypothetical protein
MLRMDNDEHDRAAGAGLPTPAARCTDGRLRGASAERVAAVGQVEDMSLRNRLAGRGRRVLARTRWAWYNVADEARERPLQVAGAEGVGPRTTGRQFDSCCE